MVHGIYLVYYCIYILEKEQPWFFFTAIKHAKIGLFDLVILADYMATTYVRLVQLKHHMFIVDISNSRN